MGRVHTMPTSKHHKDIISVQPVLLSTGSPGTCSKMWNKATNAWVEDLKQKCEKEECETYISQWGNCMPKNYQGKERAAYVSYIEGGPGEGPWDCMDCEDELCPGGCRELKGCKGRVLTKTPPSDGTAVNNRGCKNLTECQVTEYESAPPIKEDGFEYYVKDRECKPLTQCNNEEYEENPPTKYTDRLCKQLTTCTSEEWSVEPEKNPTGEFYTKDNYCRPKKSCNGQFVEDHGGPRSDRKCVIGDFTCPLGTFLSTTPMKGCSKVWDLQAKQWVPDPTHACETKYCKTFIDPSGNCLADESVTPGYRETAEGGNARVWDCTRCDTQQYYTVPPECKPFTTCTNKLLKVRVTDNGKSTNDHECEDVRACKFQEYEARPPMKSFGDRKDGMVCEGAKPIWNGHIGQTECQRLCGTDNECAAYTMYGDLCATYHACSELEPFSCECENTTDCKPEPWGGKQVGPGLGDKMWVNDADCIEFANDKEAQFYQKAGGKCYVYDYGTSSGNCSETHCFKLNKPSKRRYGFDANVHTCFLKDGSNCPVFMKVKDDTIQHNTPNVGTWGGMCSCPNGGVYSVGREQPTCTCKEAWSYKNQWYYGCDARNPEHTSSWCYVDNCSERWKTCTASGEAAENAQCEKDTLACVGGTPGRCSPDVVSAGTQVTCTAKNMLEKAHDANPCPRGKYLQGGSCVPIDPSKHFHYTTKFVMESQPTNSGKKWMDCEASARKHNPVTYRKGDQFTENRHCAPLSTCAGQFVGKEVPLDGTSKEDRKCLPPSDCTAETKLSGIRIVHAEYGVNTNTSRSTIRSPFLKPLSINQAFFQQPMTDITAVVAAECDGKKDCAFKLTAEKVGDLDPDTKKSSIIFYTCDDDTDQSSKRGNPCTKTAIERMRTNPGVEYADRIFERLGLGHDITFRAGETEPFLKEMRDYWYGIFKYGVPDREALGCNMTWKQSYRTYFNSDGSFDQKQESNAIGQVSYLGCGPPQYYTGEYKKEAPVLRPPSASCPLECRNKNCLKMLNGLDCTFESSQQIASLNPVDCTKCTMSDVFPPAIKDTKCGKMTACKKGVERGNDGFKMLTGRAIDDEPNDGTAVRDRICEIGKQLNEKCRDDTACGMEQPPSLSWDFTQKNYFENAEQCGFSRGCDDGIRTQCYKAPQTQQQRQEATNEIDNLLKNASHQTSKWKQTKRDMIARLNKIKEGDAVCSYPEPYYSVQKGIYANTYRAVPSNDGDGVYPNKGTKMYRRRIYPQSASYGIKNLTYVSKQAGFKMDRDYNNSHFLHHHHFSMGGKNHDKNIGYNTTKKDSLGRFILRPMPNQSLRRQSQLYDLITNTEGCSFDENQHSDPSSLLENLGCPPEFPYRGNNLTRDITYNSERLSNDRQYATIDERYAEPKRLKHSGPIIDDLTSKHKGRYCFRHKACTDDRCFDKFKQESNAILAACQTPVLEVEDRPLQVDGGRYIGEWSSSSYGVVNSSVLSYGYGEVTDNIDVWKFTNDLTKSGGLLDTAGIAQKDVVAIRKSIKSGTPKIIAYKAGNKTLKQEQWFYNSNIADYDMLFNFSFQERPGCKEVLDRIDKGDTCGAIHRHVPGTATEDYSGDQTTTIGGTVCSDSRKCRANDLSERQVWNGKPVGPGLGDKTWVNDADCIEFANGKRARFYQKTGGKCYVYNDGTSSGNCSTHCFKLGKQSIFKYNGFFEQTRGKRACKANLTEEECKALPKFIKSASTHFYAPGCLRSASGSVFWNTRTQCTRSPSATSKDKNNFKSGYFHSNKCTDPDGTGYPWCYTATGSSRWGGCYAEGDTMSKAGLCQRWDCIDATDADDQPCGKMSSKGVNYNCLCKDVPSIIGCDVSDSRLNNSEDGWDFCQPLVGEGKDEGVSSENLDAVEWCPYKYKTHHIDHLESNRPKSERGCPASHPWVKQWGQTDKCFKRPFCAVSMTCAQSVGGESGKTCDGIDIRANCTCKGTGPEGMCDFHGFNYRWCRTKDDQHRCGPNEDMGADKNWHFCHLRDGCPETHPYRTKLADDAPAYQKCFTQEKCTDIDPKNPSLPICTYGGYERVPGKQCKEPVGGWKDNVHRVLTHNKKEESECKTACTNDPDCEAFKYKKYTSLGNKYCTTTKSNHVATREGCRALCDQSPTCVAFAHNDVVGKCITHESGACDVSSDDIPSTWQSGWEYWANECQNYRLCDLEGGKESALFKRNPDIDFISDQKPGKWFPEHIDNENILVYDTPCEDVVTSTNDKYGSFVNFDDCLEAKNQFLGQVKDGVAFDDIDESHRRTASDGNSWQLYNESPQTFSLVQIENDTLPKGCIFVHQESDSNHFGGWMFNATGQNNENPITFTESSTITDGLTNNQYTALPSYCVPGEPCAVGVLCGKN